jgi:Na+/proline symporter
LLGYCLEAHGFGDMHGMWLTDISCVCCCCCCCLQNLPVTIAESNAGLVPAAVAQELMGAGGGFLLMLQLWMAVTATANSEQLAVASLIAYDVYR